MNGSRKEGSLPARLEKTRQRFERWRETRRGRSRIPASLWASAVTMARAYGICRTAKALRLDYYSLKKRVEEKTGSSASVPEEGTVATFLELAAPACGSGEWLLELEEAGGAKMRVHLKGGEAPDLVALCRSFWGVLS